ASRSRCSGSIDPPSLKANGPSTQIKIARSLVGHLRSRVRPALLPHSLHPRIETVSLIKNELKEKAAPRRVILEVIVKLRGHRSQLRQIIPRDRGQIVMLVVITHVQRYPIDWPIVTERLLVEIVRVMLLNPARANRMQPDRKQKREH